MANAVAEKKESTDLEAVRDWGPGMSVAEYAQIIAGAKELPDEEIDPRVMVAQILSAESLQAGLGESTAEALNDYKDEVLVIHDFKLNRSDEQYAKQGSKVYAVIDATWAKTGQRLVLTSGSQFVLAALGLMLRLDQRGHQFRVKRIDAKNGTVTRLVYVGATVTPDTEAGF